MDPTVPTDRKLSITIVLRTFKSYNQWHRGKTGQSVHINSIFTYQAQSNWNQLLLKIFEQKCLQLCSSFKCFEGKVHFWRFHSST